jgi:hypothetical protein
MSVKIIIGYRDPNFEDVQQMFYDNFSPDDWDHIIIGDDGEQVEDLARRLAIFESVLKHIDGKWVAVTYHS